MADRRDYVALEWVKGEIDETLKQARYALEAFVETPDDTNRLEFSLSYIHQVYGTLQMVEFFGAALLAEEMELLNQAMVEQKTPTNSDNLAVLMQAIIQLPSYLDQLKQGQHDLPIVILPLLNDLRAARGESLLSETALFSPDLSAAKRLSGEPDYSEFAKPQTAQLIRKLRQMYQLALLGWLKGDDADSNLEFLAKSVGRLVRLTERTKIGSFWRVVDAFVTAMKVGLVKRSPATVKVLRDIDNAYKDLVNNAQSAVEEFPAEIFLKNLLFYLAKLGETGVDRIDAVQRLYRLEEALPSEQEVETQRARLSGPDRAAVENVVTALLEEIGRLKDALDLMVRTQVKDSARLSELTGPIQQLCDTMAVVGLGNPRRVLAEQLTVIEQAQQDPVIEGDALLMDIAGALLYVEATLSGIVAESNLDTSLSGQKNDVNDAHNAVLREARNGIEQVKDAVVEYIGSHFDASLLGNAPAVLSAVRGGLVMVPLTDAGRILQAVQDYLEKTLIADKYRPQWNEMDALADALVGVEYYLERLTRDGSDTNLDILDRAAVSLEQLGLTVILSQRGKDSSADVEPNNEQEATDLPTEEALVEEPSNELASVEIPAVEDEFDALSDSIELDIDLEPEISADETLANSSIENALNLKDHAEPAVNLDEDISIEFDIEHDSIDIETPDELDIEAETVIDFSEDSTLDVSDDWSELPTVDVQESDFNDTQIIDSNELNTEAFTPTETETPLEISALEQPQELVVEEAVAAETAEANTVETDDEDDLIDDEILEIFIEEAEEVIETINEFFPKYKADEEDSASLTEFRRAFHTLKGSGRMVGASLIGETAWAVENMLNRLIDGTIVRSDDLIRVIEDVTAEVPALVKAFEAKEKADSTRADALADVATALSKGQTVDWAALDGQTIETEAPAAEVTIEDEPVVETAVEASPSDDFELPVEPETVSIEETQIIEAATDSLDNDQPLDLEIESQPLAAFDAEIEPVVDLSHEEDFDLSFEMEADDLSVQLEDSSLDIADEEFEITFEAEDDESSFSENSDSFTELPVVELDEAESILADDVDSDENLLKIFQTELDSHVEFVSNYLDDAPLGNKPPDALQRALHTIKGSAHMAGMDVIAEVVLPVESLVKDMQEQAIVASEDFVATMHEMVSLINSEAIREPGNVIPENVQAFIHNTQQLRITQSTALQEVVNDDNSLMSIFLSESMDIVMDAEGLLEGWRSSGDVGDASNILTRELDTLAQAAHAVDLIPLSQLSNELKSLYLAAESNPYIIEEKFFTLAHDGHESLISMMDRLAAGQSIRTDALFSERLQQLYTLYGIPFEVLAPKAENTLAAPAQISPLKPASGQPVVEPIDVAQPERFMVDGDAELVEIFLEEANEIIESIQHSLEGWIGDTQNTLEVESLQRDLHTLKGGARMAEVTPLGDLAHELEFLYEGLGQGQYQASDHLIGLLQQCHDRLSAMVGDIESSMTCMSAPDLVTAISHFRKYPGEPALPVNLTPVSDVQDSEPVISDVPDLSTSSEVEIDVPAPTVVTEISNINDHSDEVAESLTSDDNVDAASDIELPDDLDFDILEIFIDEAGELLNELENAVEEWRSDASNETHADELKRVLHTLKGGARLARLKDLGDQSHDFETFVVKAQQNKTNLDDSFFVEILKRQDQLLSSVEQLQKVLQQQGSDGGGFGPSVIQMVSELDESELEKMTESPTADVSMLESIAPTEDAIEEPSRTESSNKVVPFKPKADAKEAATANGKGNATQARRAQPQETVKVSANLLEGLVNLAGETSISRSRLEQEVSDFGFTLGDMDQTIDRLRDHVRRLDIETEAQIITRQERAEETNYEDFDPLEMDRYSQIQQLSRSLMEATYDLQDIKSTLSNKTRDAETILLQQSRINTELQEGLMRTRMVPFNRLLPRLRRIVRQISGELGKQVDFIVGNAEGEVDRTVLERMISPLEHLLRNAVDHGIEMPTVRDSAGKISKGTIRLDLSREGGDIVLTLADDGQGIDVEKIRAKAIERELMKLDSDLNDSEIMQFILEAGFSTAEKITQISGRGVGMDVVNSEVKQLGGNIYIDSQKGQGSVFTIRLPFTVSVNRALMVNILDDLYALPLTSIEGIVRVTPKQLAEYYQPNAPLFEYGGGRYRLEYMGALLHTGARPNVAAIDQSVPLVLVKGSDDRHSMALHVDQLMGSREIVVKTLGAQFSRVPGVSGATILGDGSVVVILDLSALIRSELVVEHHNQSTGLLLEQPEPSVKSDRPAKVMVCDDSVTVRKVTSRLLERNGMDVMLAKHGGDAITQMIDEIPDLILLDIEMPHMDGFEVASRVRHDERLKHIPIIMITSRTGSKHRERALSIGVNEYMGKPFQEGPLLERIESLLKES